MKGKVGFITDGSKDVLHFSAIQSNASNIAEGQQVSFTMKMV